MNDLTKLRQKLQDLNVLYVEDDETIRTQTKRFFEKFFKSIDVCSNGEEAWELFLKNDYDMVITDLKMPLMNGNELLEKVSKHKPQTKKVMMSGISSSDVDIALENLDYNLSKPLLIEDFMKMTESLFS